jgi:4-hydroxyphenylacetate 3-monooxygenase oxygenase component
MVLSTGESYLSRLCDGREIWLDGERVQDVTQHPALRSGAQAIANLYDLQCQGMFEEILICPSPNSGKLVGASFIEPLSLPDLVRRRRAFEIWANASYGMLGRTPDYMNVCMMALASAHSFFSKNGGKRFADNLVSYYEFVRENDLCLTHTFASPQVDRSKKLSELPGEDRFLALGIVDETNDGVVVKGARMLATLGPLSHELVAFGAGRELYEGEEDYAFAFALPVATPGLKLVCRESFVRGDNLVDHPLASRYEEMDAVAIFDNVLIPWNRIFIYRDIELSNQFKVATYFHQHVGHQVITRAIAKTELLLGVAHAIAETIGVSQILHVQERLGEMVMHLETLRACLRAAEVDAFPSYNGIYTLAFGPTNAALRQFSRNYPRLVEILQLLGGSGFLMTPSAADMEGPMKDVIEQYYRGALQGGHERVKLFRLAWDVVGEAFGVRQVLFERFFLGDPTRAMASLYQRYDKERAKAVVEHLLRSVDLYNKSGAE